MTRVTYTDIATAAGVSRAAVSYALTGRPGVGESTRAAILEVAHQLGWEPRETARLGAARRSGSVGLVIQRPARLLALEPYYMEFISGIAEVLSPLSMSLVFQTVSSVEERLETYRTWAAAGKVAGVICTDLVKDDPALPVLKTLRLPAVVTTPCDDAASVWTDIPAAMHKVVRYLAGLGHVRIARVAGGGEYTHLKDRSVAFESEIAALGLAKPIVVTTDYSPEQGMSATRVLLSTVPRPTAIIYDNDVMAAAGLGMAIEMGLKVPQELSLVAWDDSLVTRLTYPPLTSVAYDIATFGAAVVRCLLDLIDGLVVTSTSLGEPHLTVRGTTGPLQLPGR